MRAAAASRVTPLVLRQRLAADSVLFRAYQGWTGAAAGMRMPELQDLEQLLAPGRFADHCGIADLQPALGEFRYRILGTALRSCASTDGTGRIVGAADDPSPVGALDRVAFLESAFRERIVFSRRRLRDGGEQGRLCDRLVLPLGGGTGDIASVLFVHQEGPEILHGPIAAIPTLSPGPAGKQGDGSIVDEIERLALSRIDCAHEFHRSA